jgi:hypothetical protein
MPDLVSKSIVATVKLPAPSSANLWNLDQCKSDNSILAAEIVVREELSKGILWVCSFLIGYILHAVCKAG